MSETKETKETKDVPVQEKLETLRAEMNADATAVTLKQSELIVLQQRAAKSQSEYYELQTKWVLYNNKMLGDKIAQLTKDDSAPKAKPSE